MIQWVRFTYFLLIFTLFLIIFYFLIRITFFTLFEFIKMIRKRSNFRSDVKVGADDTILTLSTCFGSNNKRLVVHAVLLKDNEGDKK